MVSVKTYYAVSLLALASKALAGDSVPLSTKFLTSTSQSGSGSPDSSQSYYPNAVVCGLGTTCDGACGSDFSACPSGDGYQHCYNQTAGATCCSNGGSCDAGWYCYPGNATQALCCPNGMEQGECATSLAYNNGTTTAAGSGNATASSTGATSTSSSSSSSSSNSTGDGSNTTSASSRSLGGPGSSAGSLIAMLGVVAAGTAFL